jgi:hypothetical protein
MNRKQKICLSAGMAAFLLLGLFPPWMVATPMGSYLGTGYAFLLRPPVLEGDGEIPRLQRQGYWQCRVDAAQLSIQWAIVAVATAGLMLTFHGRKPTKPSSPAPD